MVPMMFPWSMSLRLQDKFLFCKTSSYSTLCWRLLTTHGAWRILPHRGSSPGSLQQIMCSSPLNPLTGLIDSFFFIELLYRWTLNFRRLSNFLFFTTVKAEFETRLFLISRPPKRSFISVPRKPDWVQNILVEERFNYEMNKLREGE